MPTGGPVPRCWRHGRVVRQGSAKPCTPVRFRVPPLGRDAKKRSLVRAISSGGERFLDAEEVSGSNPLSPTLKTLRFVGKTQSKDEGRGEYPWPSCSTRARLQGSLSSLWLSTFWPLSHARTGLPS